MTGLVFGLFSVLPLLILLNRQRYVIRRGQLQLRGTVLGMRTARDWVLPADSAVRIRSWPECDVESGGSWTTFQTQVLTASGWIDISDVRSMPASVCCLVRLN